MTNINKYKQNCDEVVRSRNVDIEGYSDLKTSTQATRFETRDRIRKIQEECP